MSVQMFLFDVVLKNFTLKQNGILMDHIFVLALKSNWNDKHSLPYTFYNNIRVSMQGFLKFYICLPF